MGFGAMGATTPYAFILFGAVDTTKPYKSKGLGAMDATKRYKLGLRGNECQQAWMPPHPINSLGFGATDATTP